MVANIPNSVTYATKLESVGRKLLEAYSVFVRRSGRKREEEQCKTVGRYGRNRMERCKIQQTTKEIGLSEGRGANTYSQLFLLTQAQWDDRANPKGQSPGLFTRFCDWKVWCWRVEGRGTELHSNTKESEEE